MTFDKGKSKYDKFKKNILRDCESLKKKIDNVLTNDNGGTIALHSLTISYKFLK